MQTRSIETTLRNLAINLLRTLRGAGKPYDLVHDAAEFLHACADDPGQRRPTDFAAMLVGWREWKALPPTEQLLAHAENEIISGALQIIASRLAGQPTHESAGEHEMFAGIRQRETLTRPATPATRSPGSRSRRRS